MDLVVENENLLREILLRTPAKALIKFKCVSKRWLALISDRQFANEHTANNAYLFPLGVYLYSQPLTSDLKSIPIDRHSSLPPLEFIYGAAILDACNGLVLCSSSVEFFYAVCNPTTRDSIILPKVNANNPNVSARFYSLAFDPKKSANYKVVLLNYEKSGECEFFIFASEENSWRSVRLRNAVPDMPATSKMIFSNGAIQWYSTTHIHYALDANLGDLIAFKMPRHPIIRKKKIRYFGECGGKLCLALGGPCTYNCNIYEMEMNTHRWILKYEIDLTHKICQRTNEGPKFHVLYILKRPNSGTLALLLATPGEFVLYYPEYETIEILGEFLPNNFGEIPRSESELGGYSSCYIESLFPV